MPDQRLRRDVPEDPSDSRGRRLVADCIAALCFLAIGIAAAALYLAQATSERQQLLDRDVEQLSLNIERASGSAGALQALALAGQVDGAIKQLLRGEAAVGDATVIDHLRAMLREPRADDIYIVDTRGVVRDHLTWDGRTDAVGHDFTSRRHVQLALGGSAGVDATIDTASGARSILVAAPIRETAAGYGRVIGALVMQLDVQTLDALLARQPGIAVLLTPAGAVFSGNQQGYLRQASTTDAFDAPALSEAMQAVATQAWSGWPQGWKLVFLQDRVQLQQGMQALAIGTTTLLLGMLAYYIASRRHYLRRAQQDAVRALHDEQNEAQRQLTEREQQTRNLLESSPAALIVTAVNGRVIFFNQHVLDMFRVDDATFRATGLKGRYVTQGAREEFFNKLQNDGFIDGFEINFYRGDGTTVWVQVASRIGMYGDEKAAFGWFADVTLRKQQAEALQAAKDAAEAATAAKSSFLANMSHEIRTPMNAVIGLTHLALRTRLDTQQRDYIGKAHTAGQSLLGIINDILDFSKIEADRLEMESVDFDLDETLSRVTTVTNEKVWEKDLELLFEVPPDVPRWLRSDPLRLGQVLTNLINNAVKFTERGQILVRCHHRTLEDKRIELKIEVQDTGIGMSREQMDRLFQAFSQADESTTRKFGGTGLGLSISKRLVEMAGGTIGVDSSLGAGSVFHFTWLCEPATTVRARGRVLPEELRDMHVLVVDDNDVARVILREALLPLGFVIDTVASGADALDAMEAQAVSNPYGLVFTDWKMPGMDGLELTRRIKTTGSPWPIPPVILVTAFGRDGMQHEADAFLMKPINQSLLVDTVIGLYADEATTQAADYGHGDEVPALHGLRVLLTEDNEINQQIALELMRSAGVEVDVADNGRIAVDKLEAGGPDRYHLVFMDLQMPVMDGHQATIAIRAQPRFAQLPIVAMTAHAMVEERQRCLAEGMDDHVTKPVDPRVLYRTLQKWCGQQITSAPTRAPAAEPAAPVQTPDAMDAMQATLPMLDLRGALRRVAGNHKLYADLLRRYRDDQTNFAAMLRELLAQGDLATALRVAHTLKGVSGNIGAGAVQQAARALEDALQARAPASEVDALIGAAQAALAPLLAAVEQWFEAQSIAAASVAAVEVTKRALMTPASTPDAMRADLMRLCGMLDEMDSESEQVLQQLHPQASAHMSIELLDAVARHVRDFDFDEAAVLLRGHPLLQQRSSGAQAPS